MKRTVIGMCVLALAAQSAQSAVLYGPDQMTSGAGWGVNSSNAAEVAATFGYDYSADGIPEAPNSGGGDTAQTGLKVEANLTAAPGDFLTAFPMGQSFTDNHQLRFDSWMNYSVDDRENNGGAGTTEFLGGGVGYDSITADVASGAQAIYTNEGGSGSDYRAFKDGFFIDGADMTAGTRNATGSTHYTDFFPATASPPAEQFQVPGTNRPGSAGFQWVTWIITSVNQNGAQRVQIDLQKPDLSTLRIVNIDCTDTSDGSSGCTSEGNVSLFYADFFSSVTGSPELTFGIFDNVTVTDVPEPASLALLGLGALIVARRRRA